MKTLLTLIVLTFLTVGCTSRFPLLCDVKGNINAKGQRIYYVPGHQNYLKVKLNLPGERVFCTTQEAEQNGWRSPLK